MDAFLLLLDPLLPRPLDNFGGFFFGEVFSDSFDFLGLGDIAIGFFGGHADTFGDGSPLRVVLLGPLSLHLSVDGFADDLLSFIFGHLLIELALLSFFLLLLFLGFVFVDFVVQVVDEGLFRLVGLRLL